MQRFESFVSSLSVGAPSSSGVLSMYPLLREAPAEPFYDMLSEAVAAGTLRISEVSDAGSVPELLVLNDGARPVLIVDGEELIGAKQNRIVNLTVLVPARSKIKLPVTCVEAGRWRHVSPEFAPAERAHYASGRRSKLEDVSMSLLASSRPVADQSAVWSDIAAKSERLQARSSTSAAAAMYDQNVKALDRMIAEMTPIENQVGAVFTIRGAIAGLDAFDSPRTWNKAMPKLIRSYGLDALDAETGAGGSASSSPVMFVASVSKQTCKAYPGVGEGQDLRFEGAGIVGAALDTPMGVVHAVAFPAPAGDSGRSDSISSRRRHARGF